MSQTYLEMSNKLQKNVIINTSCVAEMVVKQWITWRYRPDL